MAKRKVRYRTRVKKVYRKSRRRGGGMKQAIDGVLAGVAAAAATKYIGSWGNGLGYYAVGEFRKNTTLKTLGGVALGRQIAGMLPMIGNGSGSNGGIFEG